jgi:hypothetical protein
VINTSRPFGLSRRHVLAGLAAAPALTATVPAAAETAEPRWTPQQAQTALRDGKGTKLVLLGTAAGPVPGRSRQMTSHVMLSNGSAYVLDCGMGVTDQYARTGIPFGALKSIFITHHHPDHNIEYGPLLIVGRVQGPTSRRARVRSAAAQADDRRLHPRLQADCRFLGGGLPHEAALRSKCGGNLWRWPSDAGR